MSEITLDTALGVCVICDICVICNISPFCDICEFMFFSLHLIMSVSEDTIIFPVIDTFACFKTHV